MNTSTHAISPEEVMAFVDGERSGVWIDFVAGHISECGECQQTVAEFRKSSRALRTWRVEPVPEGIEAKLQAGSSQDQREGRLAFASRLHLPVWGKWALGVGLTAVAIVFLGQRNSHAPSQSVFKTEQFAQSQVQPPATHSRKETLERYRQELERQQKDQLSSSLENSSVDTDIVGGEVGHGAGAGKAPEVATLSQVPMIARTVSLAMVVKDFAAARATLDAILVRHRAYAAELTVNTADSAQRTLVASLRVPAPELGTALNELKLLGRVENETQSGEEVTQQHADLVARLKNSRETEQRLQAILQQRTGKISDVLQVEQEIARVRGEIEQMEAEQKSLEHRVDFATVNLNLADVYQAQLTLPTPSMATRLHNGFVAGFHNATETLLGIVLFLAEDGPALLIWLLILGLPVLFVWRRYRRALAAA